jgi:hypothetical protein
MRECRGQAALDAANEWTAASNNGQFRIQQFDGDPGRLLLIASFDLSYYHELELELTDVMYIELPWMFDEPVARYGTAEEREVLRSIIDLENEDSLFVFQVSGWSNQGKPAPVTFRVVAQDVVARLGLVFHYNRPDLKEGETIAPWVPKDPV